MRHFIAGLRYDAGDYAKHVEGKAEKGEVLEWDRQNVRSWDAANLIESMLVRTSDVSGSDRG